MGGSASFRPFLFVLIPVYYGHMEELERTYLLKEFPKGALVSPSKKLLDIYVPQSSAHPSLRIRQRGGAYEITKKQPVVEGDASRQLETTIALTLEEFADLSKVEGKRVEKTRYYYIEEGFEYEIDVFEGALEGLVLVDIEFTSIESKDAFTMPPWCLAEVTQEHFIAGGMLCGKSYTDIEESLSAFSYNKHIHSQS